MTYPDIEAQRKREIATLDGLAESYFKNACAGDKGAADLLMDISERRAKLLGLDAPLRAKVEVITYDTEELIRQYEELSRSFDGKSEDPLD